MVFDQGDDHVSQSQTEKSCDGCKTKAKTIRKLQKDNSYLRRRVRQLKVSNVNVSCGLLCLKKTECIWSKYMKFQNKTSVLVVNLLRVFLLLLDVCVVHIILNFPISYTRDSNFS